MSYVELHQHAVPQTQSGYTFSKKAILGSSCKLPVRLELVSVMMSQHPKSSSLILEAMNSFIYNCSPYERRTFEPNLALEDVVVAFCKLEKSLWVGSLLLRLRLLIIISRGSGTCPTVNANALNRSIGFDNPVRGMNPTVRKQEDQQETAGTGGSSEGTGTIPGVPNESTVVSATSNEGTGTKPGVPDKKKVITEEKVILEWGSEQESEYSEEDQLDDKEKYDKEGDGDDEGDDHISDTQDTNDEDDETESDGDEIYKYKIRVRKDEDVEMTNAEVEDFKKGNEEISNVAQADVKKTEEIKDTAKKAELPPTRSSLSVSLGFGDQFLKLSSNKSLVSIVKDNTDSEINSLLEVKIRSEVPLIQSPSVLRVPVSVISKPTVLTPVQETSLVAPITTLPLPSVSTTPLVSQQTTTPITSPPITTDAPIITSVVLESDALSIVQLRVAKLEMFVSELKKIDHSAKAFATLKSQVPTVVDNILDLKSVMIFKGRPNHGRKTKGIRTKESKSSKKPSTTQETTKGKTSTKGFKTGKSASAKEPVKEPIAEVIMDDAGDDVVRDDDQPQATSEPKTRKTLNPYWFKLPPRPPTPDPEWNKRQVVLDQPAHPWFNQTVSDSKYPLTFNDLMATPINFSKGNIHTSIMKTKVAWYEIKGIDDMVPTLWSTIKHAYDKDASIGIKHWGERRKLWYQSQVSKFSKQNIYSTKTILGLKSVSVKKLYGYGYLEEIMAKRSDQQLYKFKEGDFVDLHLNDIKDMLLLAVQHKLFHLEGSDIVDFIVALCMFTRSLILKRRVKDLQLGVEKPYTPSYDPPGIVYEDLDKHKRVLRADELYKFSDGTLKSVCDEIHHRVLDFHLDYKEMPNRKWTAVNRKRLSLMIELIDKQLREMEIIKNLERLVGARELEMDYKLMARTI
ncbi:hypothetical protein Tco_0256332 [Tanacetum coccineum]